LIAAASSFPLGNAVITSWFPVTDPWAAVISKLAPDITAIGLGTALPIVALTKFVVVCTSTKGIALLNVCVLNG
jgi:hypothetical protein